jgi:hypothetical protein
MADGLFYLDTREPHFVSNLGAITMTTTAKAMYAAANFPTLGGGYFSRPGKAIKISAAGDPRQLVVQRAVGNGGRRQRDGFGYWHSGGRYQRHQTILSRMRGSLHYDRHGRIAGGERLVLV